MGTDKQRWHQQSVHSEFVFEPQSPFSFSSCHVIILCLSWYYKFSTGTGSSSPSMVSSVLLNINCFSLWDAANTYWVCALLLFWVVPRLLLPESFYYYKARMLFEWFFLRRRISSVSPCYSMIFFFGQTYSMNWWIRIWDYLLGCCNLSKIDDSDRWRRLLLVQLAVKQGCFILLIKLCERLWGETSLSSLDCFILQLVWWEWSSIWDWDVWWFEIVRGRDINVNK